MGLPVGRQMVAGRRRTDGLQLVEDIAQQAKSLWMPSCYRFEMPANPSLELCKRRVLNAPSE